MPDTALVDNVDYFTSSFYNANIRQQVVAQVTSATRPTGVEGRMIYETDTDYVLIHDGAAWQLVSGVGVYTPSLTNMAIGSGGSAAASVRWSFNGGVDGGVLVMSFGIILGTSGASVSGVPEVSLPSGFTIDAGIDAKMPLGLAYLDDVVGADFTARLQRASGGVAVGRIIAADAAISSTVPFTWAAGDGIFGQATVRGTFST